MEKSSLSRIRMASPCPVSWEQMQGDDRVRFCEVCQKKVFNLCALPADEARRVIEAHEGKLCALVYGRRDGTLLLEDCPVGAAASRRRFWRRAAAALGAVVLAVLNGQTLAPSRKGTQSPDRVPPSVPGAATQPAASQLSPEDAEMLKMLGSLGYTD